MEKERFNEIVVKIAPSFRPGSLRAAQVLGAVGSPQLPKNYLKSLTKN